MRIVVLKNAQAVAEFAANHIIALLNKKSHSVLGLATGSTPIRLYKQLILANEQKKVSYKNVTTFNLDEYLGLAGTHLQSYRHFMNHYFFDHIDINKEDTFLPKGITSDPMLACAEYEKKIKEKGGIDIQLLGIGSNGHIGFNEPSSSLASRTRIKALSEDTIAANKRFFAVDEFQPSLSITMGIGTILESREIILLATGSNKAEAIRNTIEGPVAASCPASILQMHQHVMIVIDEEAAQNLKDLTFYKHIERENQRLTSSSYCDLEA